MAVLDRLARASGAASAAALAAIGLVIAAQILARLAGHQIPAADDFAAWAMAASAFLALPYAMRHGDHIRVTLVIGRLGLRARRGAEVFSVVMAILASGAFAFYSVKMAWWSWTFHDISSANDATPLWIPQLGMAIGTVVFCIAFAEELVLLLRGKQIRGDADEIAHTE